MSGGDKGGSKNGFTGSGCNSSAVKGIAATAGVEGRESGRGGRLAESANGLANGPSGRDAEDFECIILSSCCLFLALTLGLETSRWSASRKSEHFSGDLRFVDPSSLSIATPLFFSFLDFCSETFEKVAK